MKRLFAILAFVPWLAAAPQRVELLQELIRVEAMETRTVLLFPLRQQGGQLDLRFDSKRGGEGVQLAVYAAGSNVPVATTGYELTSAIRVPLTRDREYRVEIENKRQRLGHAVVDVEIALLFGAVTPAPQPAGVRTLEPARRFYTILVSLALFGLIAGYAALRLGPSIVERWRGN